MKIGGKIEEIELNGYIVSVITPKENISYEEGVKRIDKILAEEAAERAEAVEEAKEVTEGEVDEKAEEAAVETPVEEAKPEEKIAEDDKG